MAQRTRQVFTDGQLVATEQFEMADEIINDLALRDRLQRALAANATYAALASPTANQTNAQVRRLSRENNALIRLVLALVDDVSDSDPGA